MNQSNIDTPYGSVNRKVLDDLSDSLDTGHLLAAARVVEDISRRADGPDGVSHQLSELYEMAETIFGNGGELRNAALPVWELADVLANQIGEWVDKLRKAEDALDQLSMLVPDENDQEDDLVDGRMAP